VTYWHTVTQIAHRTHTTFLQPALSSAASFIILQLSALLQISMFLPPDSIVCSFICSLRAGIQPTLDPSAETFILIQCDSPGTQWELAGVCGVCAHCVGWRKEQ